MLTTMLTLAGRLSRRPLQRFIACWSCSTESHGVTCPTCGKIQPPPKDINYFKVFNQEETLMLEPKILQSRFRAMQSVLHPDKFAKCSEKEKSYSADHSALVNQAYQILRNPVQRATYLLKLRGISLEEVQLPQDFLLEMMDLNEAIDDADASRKEELLEQIERFQEKEMEALQELFPTGKLKEASESLAKVKFFENLKNRLS